MESKSAKLVGTKGRMVVTLGWGMGKMGRPGVKGTNCHYKIRKLEGPNEQNSDYS